LASTLSGSFYRQSCEEPSSFVDSKLAYVNMLLFGTEGSTLAVGGEVKHPALIQDKVKGHLLVERNSHHLVRKESSGWLMESFVRSEIVMSKRKPLTTDKNKWN